MGRHALVTGAAGGIGQAICLALADDAVARGEALQLSLAVSALDARTDALIGRLAGRGVPARAFAADLTDPAQCEALVARATDAAASLDALVCAAGASGPGRLADLPVAQWDRTFHLNTRSVWLLAKAAHPWLARSRGSLTAIASMSGLSPHPGYGAYSAAKAALIMLCRQLAQEWAADGIRANTVCPGMIRTPLTEAVYQDEATLRKREALVPLGRVGRADDVAQAVVYLVSEAASYVTGQNLVVDGGISDHMLSLIPGRPGKPPVQQ